MGIRKRQFNRRISEWDFEKNTKKAERISVLASIKRQNGIETTTIRGRKLDRAKVERWIKQDGAVLQSEEMNRRDDGKNSGMSHSILVVFRPLARTERLRTVLPRPPTTVERTILEFLDNSDKPRSS